MKKRRNCSLFLAILMLVSLCFSIIPSAMAEQANYVINENFESDLDSWWFRSDWNGGNWEVKDGVGADGSKALQAVSTVDSPNGEHNIGVYYTLNSGAPGPVTLEEGKTYKLSMDVYRGAGVDSRVYIDDEGGKLGNGAEASKNGEWQTVSTTFTATSEGYNFRLVANALAKGEIVYVDNITLAEVVSGGDNKYNFTFDKNIDGWSGDTDNFAWSSEKYHDASGALSVNEGNAKKTMVISVVIPVEAGEQYTVGYYGYKDTDAATYLDVHDGNVDNNQLIQLGTDVKGKWLYNGATITPTKDEVRMRIIVDNYSSGNFYVDDIVFEKYEAPEVMGSNLLNGGDLEGSLDNLWFRNDWNGGTWEVKDGVGVDGSKGLQAVSAVDSPDGSHNIGLYYSTLGQQPGPLSLEEGKTYELGFDVYRGAGVDSSVYMDDEGGNAVSVSATKNGEWEHVSARFVATSAGYNFRLVANAVAKGEIVYVDNMYVKEVGAEPSIDDVEDKSLAVNGSFENGRGATANGWRQTSVWNRTAEDTQTVNGEEVTVSPVDGDYMMRVMATSTAICMGEPIEVKPNTYYTFSGYVYRTDSQGTTYLNILDEKTHDIPGTQIGTDTVGKWTRVSYTFFSGDYTTVYPRMVVDGTADAQPTGNPIYYDDIQFKELAYTGSKAFPEGVSLTDIKAEYELASDTTSASFAVTKDGLYITSLEDGSAAKYLSEAIASPLTSIINGEPVTWINESSELVDIKNGKKLHAIFMSEDGNYKIEAVWTARDGVGPLEYNQYLTGVKQDISISYDETVSANFKVEADGEATLYRFSRSRVNDGSDPYFAEGVLDTALKANETVISSVENGYSPVASILPYQVIDIDGDHGVYFGHYWSFGKLLVRTNEENEVAITTYLSDDPQATIDREQGETLEIPGFFIGAYEGDIDDGSNDMKNWFWEYKITRSLYENENEPHLEMGDIGITSELMQENLFDTWPDIADYLDVIKIDYIWTLPDGTNPRVDKVQEDTWTPDATRYYDEEKGKVYFGVYETIKDFAANDGIDNPLYLSLYMADTYLGMDIGTKEGREAQLQALKERFRPQDNEYGIGYDYWRSDFVVEQSYNYDSHEGLLWILDNMIEYSDEFRYEHCSGAGSLKDFTTLERMAFMTTEDTARPLNHRMSLYANTYMISPTQLKGDLNMTYNDRDYGALTGYGPIIGYDEEGNMIDVWTDEDYVTYTLRTSMLGASMVCFNKEGLEMNLDTIKEHYDLYNNTHRAILRDCNVYHILEAPTGWDWNDWDGIMYYNENIEKGTVQLFKENETAPDEKTIVLKGLDAATMYSLSFVDRTEQNTVMSGADLMTKGIKVTGMDTRYDSEIIYIEKLSDIDISVEAIFEDDNEDSRPEEVVIELVTNGESAGDDKLVLNKANGFKGVFENYQSVIGGDLVEYSIMAPDIEGYNYEITGNASEGFVVKYTATKIDDKPVKPEEPKDDPKEDPKDEPEKPNEDAPKTGEESGLMIWMLALLSAAVTAMAAARRVRKRSGR